MSSPLTLPFTSSVRPKLLLPPKPSSLFRLRAEVPFLNPHLQSCNNKIRRAGICRAELAQEAPFAIAIGACILSSLVLADAGGRYSEEEDEDDEGAVIGPTDARFAVMSIMSFIPYFNWLSWVFALMDTGKQRYAVYSIVYLAPYLRTNLSLSPDESWLPITSIVLCILHVQLESSIRNGDLDGFWFFNGDSRHLSSSASKERDHERHNSFEGKELDDKNRLRDGIRRWGMPKRRQPFQEVEPTNQEANSDEDKKDL